MKVKTQVLILMSFIMVTSACTTRVLQTNAEDITIKVKRKGLAKERIAEKAMSQAVDHCRKNGFKDAKEIKSVNDRRFRVVEYHCDSGEG